MKHDHIQATSSIDHFLAELSELCRKYGIAIGGEAALFEMESEDYRLAYTCDDDGKLAFTEV